MTSVTNVTSVMVVRAVMVVRTVSREGREGREVVRVVRVVSVVRVVRLCKRRRKFVGGSRPLRNSRDPTPHSLYHRTARIVAVWSGEPSAARAGRRVSPRVRCVKSGDGTYTGRCISVLGSCTGRSYMGGWSRTVERPFD